MSILGVDYSDARPDPNRLYAEGYRFACRYLYGSRKGKALTVDELAALHAAGLAVVLNWEWNETEASGGYTAGVDRATRAASAVRALGAPNDAVVYFSVDSDTVTTAQAREYFRGVRSVFPRERIGVYGGRRIVSAAIGEKWCNWFWQTYAWSVLDGKLVWVPDTHIQQYHNGYDFHGSNVDLDRALLPEFGQWKADDMPTPEEIAEAVWARKMKQVLDDRVQPAETFLRYNNKQIYANAAALAALRADVAEALGRDPVDENAIVEGVLAGLGGKDAATIVSVLKAVLPEELAREVGELLAQ